MGVNIRLSTATHAHRATQDVDLVSDDSTPTVLEILSERYSSHGDHAVVIDGVEIEIIETMAVTDEDLAGLDDDPRLFVLGHRWALETAAPVQVSVVGVGSLTLVAVATAAGLVAAKSHAAGYPSPTRRATKHGGDLYDIFRLVEVFDAQGELRSQIAKAPGGLGRLVAQVVQAVFLANPPAAMRRMLSATSGPLDVDRITDVLEPFVAALLRSDRDTTK